MSKFKQVVKDLRELYAIQNPEVGLWYVVLDARRFEKEKDRKDVLYVHTGTEWVCCGPLKQEEKDDIDKQKETQDVAHPQASH